MLKCTRTRCPIVFLLLILAAVFGTGNESLAQLVLVRVDVAAGSATTASPAPDGTDWGADSFKYLQDALDYANDLLENELATEVHLWLADGDYFPDRDSANPSGSNSRAARFNLIPNVDIYGGFSGNETVITQRNPALYNSALDGNIQNSGLQTDNSYHVVFANDPNITVQNTRVDGVTIRNGYIAVADSIDPGGAGIDISVGASPHFHNCTVHYNRAAGTLTFPPAPGFGAGVRVDGSAPVFTQCVIKGNVIIGDGDAGGIGSPLPLSEANVGSLPPKVTLHVEKHTE